MKGIRLNTAVRIVIGISQVALGLLMIMLCKHFIDETVMKGSTHDILLMIGMLVGTVLTGIVLRQ
jgi:hypothetical protein